METAVEEHAKQVSQGERFEFGKNWQRFLSVVDDERITEAEKSLTAMLELDTLDGKRFLDIGCGSGLFSLVARRLGATVHSFDYDSQAVGCAEELRRRYFPDDKTWRIEQGSALDTSYLQMLEEFDIVYSWGVLHHTGQMWQALDNAQLLVADGGYLFISIYNDQGSISRLWRFIKHMYNILPEFLRPPYVLLMMFPVELRSATISLIKLQPLSYIRTWTHYVSQRGMSRWYDMVDWVGGYPFEVAKPDQIFDFYRAKGFTLLKLKTVGGGYGCNEFVFQRASCSSAGS